MSRLVLGSVACLLAAASAEGRRLDHGAECTTTTTNAARLQQCNNLSPTMSGVCVHHGQAIAEDDGLDGLVQICCNAETDCFKSPSPPPSPPPPSPSPPPPPVPYAVSMAVVVSGDVSSFTPTIIAELKAAYAAKVGVDASLVTLVVESASVKLTFTASMPSIAAANAAAIALQAVTGSSADAATFLTTASFTPTVESIASAPAAVDSTPQVCESWCNQWTCGDTTNCNDCSICTTLAAGTHCEPWCNDYTCAEMQGTYQMCGGCSFCSPQALLNRCMSWCNIYTCGNADCVGCTTCATPTAWCEGWCNVHTSSNKYCAGCSTG